jgi:8-amino-3,8-dideoxy-alpha-D-manno-octulosonate transaminase
VEIEMNNKIGLKLAIQGGEPVRTKPLPPESPGIHYINEDEIDNVCQVLKARSPFRFYGPDVQHMCDKLEAEFRKLYGVKYALGVSSGTDALYISLAALGVGPGDEVLLPGYLWTSCLNAIIRLGAIPKLVDINDTFNMSPEDLEQKIGPHSKVVLVIHMSGLPGDIEDIIDIAQKHGLKVLEDCAQSNGATLNGKPVGTFGDIGIVSFQINKSMTAGEGGMIVCNDDHLYKRCFGIHDLGYARNEVGILMDTSCDEQYHMWGCGARMSELTGAVLLAQVAKLKDINKAMREAKWEIRKGIETIEGISLRRVNDPQGDCGAFIISIFETPEICQSFSEALIAEGIRGEGYAIPYLVMENWGLHWYFNNKSLVNRRSLHENGWPWTLAQNDFAQNYQYGKGTLPVCDDMAGRSSLLKVQSCLTREDIDDIVTAFKKVAHHLLKK